MIYTTQFLSLQEIERHHLQGLTYSQTKDRNFQKIWKRQVVRNHMISDELRFIEPLFEQRQVDVTLLKGFALIGDLYQDWGARFASDVDILVDPKDLPTTLGLLQNCGFKIQEEEKWKGNQFKVVLCKSNDLLEITIEVHTALFWHQKVETYATRPHPAYRWFRQLDHHDFLIHLCGHLAFQHTFIKLFWLFDIQHYLKRFGNEILWPEFWRRARQYRVVESCQLCLWMLDYSIVWDPEVSLKQRALRRLCTQKFLLHPRRHWVRYFLIKTLLKDRWVDSLDYYGQLLVFKSGLKFRQLLAFAKRTGRGFH